MGKILKILHLEDSSSDAKLVSNALRKGEIDFEILVVDTKAEFIYALENVFPDIILSDHSLPSFNSHEALDIVQQKGIKVPFILITGNVSEEFAVAVIKKGADDYILKDRLKRLPMSINNALEKYRFEKERQAFIDNIIESEERYRSLYENSIDGIMLTDMHGEILTANPAACKIFQMTEEEICKAGNSGLMDHSDPRLAGIIKERQRTGKVKSEITFKHKDGSKFPGELTSAVFKDAAGNERTSMLVRDISERKAAEELISESEFQYRSLIQDLPVAVYTTDQKGGYRKILH